MYILDNNGVISQLTTGNSYLGDVKFTSEIGVYDNIVIIATSSLLNDALLGKIISLVIKSDIVRSSEERSYFGSLLQVSSLFKSMINSGINSLVEETLINELIQSITRDYEVHSILKYIGIDANELGSLNLQLISLNDKVKLLDHLFASIRVVVSAVTREFIDAISHGSTSELFSDATAEYTSDLSHTLKVMNDHIFASKLYYSIHDLPSEVSLWLTEGISIKSWALSSSINVNTHLLNSAANMSCARDINGYQHIKNDFDVSWFIKLERVIKDLYAKYDIHSQSITMHANKLLAMENILNKKEWIISASSNISDKLLITRDDTTGVTTIDLNAETLAELIHSTLMQNNGYEDLIASIPPSAGNNPLPDTVMHNNIENIVSSNFKLEIAGDRSDYVIRFNADNLGANKDVDILRVHRAGAKVRFSYNINDPDHINITGRMTYKNRIYCHDQCELNNDPVGDKDAVRKSYLTNQLTPITDNISALTSKVTELENNQGASNGFNPDDFVKSSSLSILKVTDIGEVILYPATSKHRLSAESNNFHLSSPSGKTHDISFSEINLNEGNFSKAVVQGTTIPFNGESVAQAGYFAGLAIDTNLDIIFDFMPSNNRFSLFYNHDIEENTDSQRAFTSADIQRVCDDVRMHLRPQELTVVLRPHAECIKNISDTLGSQSGFQANWLPDLEITLYVEPDYEDNTPVNAIFNGLKFSLSGRLLISSSPNSTSVSGSIGLKSKRRINLDLNYFTVSDLPSTADWNWLKCTLSLNSQAFSFFKGAIVHPDKLYDRNYTLQKWREDWENTVFAVYGVGHPTNTSLDLPKTRYLQTSDSYSTNSAGINKMCVKVCYKPLRIMTQVYQDFSGVKFNKVEYMEYKA